MSPIEEQQRDLTRRLDDIRARGAALGYEERQLEAEIASVTKSLDARRRLPMARTVVASPCDVPWSAMAGDDRTRFCKSCEKNVHNLSAMTSAEVEAFLEANASADACVRLYERSDGTVHTADCPVGVKRRRTRALLLATLGAGACSLFAFTAAALTLALARADVPPPVVRVVEVAGPTVQVQGPPVAVLTVPDGYAKLPAPPAGTGWLLVSAPEGTRVFEGSRLLGVAPLVLTLPAGSHALRAEGTTAGRKWSETFPGIEVQAAGRASIHINAPLDDRVGGRRAPLDRVPL